MVVIATQVVQLVDVEGVPFVRDYFELPFSGLVACDWLSLNQSANEILVQFVFFDVKIAFVYHVVEQHLRSVLMFPAFDVILGKTVLLKYGWHHSSVKQV